MGDLAVDHLVAWDKAYRPGQQGDEIAELMPTDYSVLSQSNWWTYGGYPFMAQILESWKKEYDLKIRGKANFDVVSVDVNELSGSSGGQLSREAPDLPDLQHVYWRLHEYPQKPGSKKKVYRLKNKAYLDNRLKPETRKKRSNLVAKAQIDDANSALSSDTKMPPRTVIIDRNYGFRDYPDIKPFVTQMVQNEPSTNSFPAFICTVDNCLPDNESKLWKALSRNARNESMVLLNAKLLRASGIDISHRVSWEKTVEDYVKAHCESVDNPKTWCLSGFRWVVTLFGVTGCILTENPTPGDPSQSKHTFIYDPWPPTPFYRNMEKDGRMRGSKSLYVTAILNARFSGRGDHARAKRIQEWIKAALAHDLAIDGQTCLTNEIMDTAASEFSNILMTIPAQDRQASTLDEVLSRDVFNTFKEGIFGDAALQDRQKTIWKKAWARLQKEVSCSHLIKELADLSPVAIDIEEGLKDGIRMCQQLADSILKRNTG